MLSDGTYRYAYDDEGNRTFKFVDADQSGTSNSGDTDVSKYTWDHRRGGTYRKSPVKAYF